MNYLIQLVEDGPLLWVHTDSDSHIIAINWMPLGPRSTPIKFDPAKFHSVREPGPEAVPTVRDILLNDPRPETRALAAKTLGELDYV